MNDEQAVFVRIFQYLLAKESFLKQQIYNKEKLILRKNVSQEDIFDYWVALLKFDIWKDFAGDIWNLFK